MPRPRWTTMRALAFDEMRTFLFAATVMLVFSIFLATAGAGFGPVPFGAFLSDLEEGFRGAIIALVAMMLLVEPVRRFGPADGALRIAALAAAVVAGGVLGTLGQLYWAIEINGDEKAGATGFWGPLAITWFILAAMLVAVAEFHRREVQSVEAMRSAEEQRAALEQQSLQARVRTLEAQIEPHFLFNTLANVRRLYDIDAAAGEVMMSRLMSYLEIALPSMRDARSTLEREVQLIGAYLDLQQVRMGRRLAYAIDIAPALRGLDVPPMMLLTLVENAIKHGLTPTREGGRVEVSASAAAGELRLVVADTGRGFGAGTSGGGTGLANIRARLAAMFGTRASLHLAPRQPHGFTATITLPVSA